MDIINRMTTRLARNYNRWRYGLAVAKVLNTPPLLQGKLPFMLLSMVHQRDVLSYLAAVKSFTKYLNPERVVVICDPSIEAGDRQLLKSQLPHIELRSADEFVHPAIPRGGCWERLFAISEYNRDNYVIQLDADTLALRDLVEIETAIKNNCGFVLGEKASQPLVTFRQAATRARAQPDAHIQTHAEAALISIGLADSKQYVRGCAGFTGFPASSDMRDQLVDFSSRMHHALGDAWSRWGTEQVTSNYLVANAPDTAVLPFPKYGTPDQTTNETVFLHFIGSLRFANATYQQMTELVINSLKEKQ